MLIESGLSRAPEDERPPAEEIRAQLARVLQSGGFVRSARIAEMLRFLVERLLGGLVEPPKETILGVELFGRTPGYDTQADPVVRVTARRLREKLEDYYRGPGSADLVRIELPIGRYAVECYFQISGGLLAPSNAAGSNDLMASSHPLLGSGRALFDWFQAGRHRAGRRLSCGGAGSPSHPAFSPDGQALAFDWLGPGDATEHVYVQQLDADGPARFSSSGAREWRPAWSPDGGRIAYVRQRNGRRFQIWTAAVLGVGDRLLAEVSSASGDAPRVEWSPDGKVIVTSTCDRSGAQNVLLLILVDGGVQQQITVPPAAAWGDDEAVFSPEGHMLAFRRRTGAKSGDIYLHPMTSRAAERRVTWDESEICGLTWAPGGKSLIVAVRRDKGLPALWRIPLNHDLPDRLTPEGEAVAWPAVSRRKGRLAYVRHSPAASLSKTDRTFGEIMVVEDFS